MALSAKSTIYGVQPPLRHPSQSLSSDMVNSRFAENACSKSAERQGGGSTTSLRKRPSRCPEKGRAHRSTTSFFKDLQDRLEGWRATTLIACQRRGIRARHTKVTVTRIFRRKPRSRLSSPCSPRGPADGGSGRMAAADRCPRDGLDDLNPARLVPSRTTLTGRWQVVESQVDRRGRSEAKPPRSPVDPGPMGP